MLLPCCRSEAAGLQPVSNVNSVGAHAPGTFINAGEGGQELTLLTSVIGDVCQGGNRNGISEDLGHCVDGSPKMPGHCFYLTRDQAGTNQCHSTQNAVHCENNLLDAPASHAGTLANTTERPLPGISEDLAQMQSCTRSRHGRLGPNCPLRSVKSGRFRPRTSLQRHIGRLGPFARPRTKQTRKTWAVCSPQDEVDTEDLGRSYRKTWAGTIGILGPNVSEDLGQNMWCIGRLGPRGPRSIGRLGPNVSEDLGQNILGQTLQRASRDSA
ncbi:hypothetical protein Deipe_3839 (plasmid) [Deinococcus peraridilitoris DSM 19664]|uniref:Uncharacterized protein n=1 Tax=Deinococcus peraridilitoris (strain DSM 19664 / LMG 22246 / CIP 109416 / KR-200) TaxID=937777 RepID=L0A5Y5_DEIPD|nr:hypothetical protein Deipe_3839 [Deinococcus peraridilitoris DSM 19664]